MAAWERPTTGTPVTGDSTVALQPPHQVLVLWKEGKEGRGDKEKRADDRWPTCTMHVEANFCLLLAYQLTSIPAVDRTNSTSGSSGSSTSHYSGPSGGRYRNSRDHDERTRNLPNRLKKRFMHEEASGDQSGDRGERGERGERGDHRTVSLNFYNNIPSSL